MMKWHAYSRAYFSVTRDSVESAWCVEAGRAPRRTGLSQTVKSKAVDLGAALANFLVSSGRSRDGFYHAMPWPCPHGIKPRSPRSPASIVPQRIFLTVS